MKSPMMYIFSMILGVNIMQPVIASEHAEDALNSTMALLDFKNPGDLIDWRIVNDGVMGGLSQGEIIMTEDHTAVFQGNLSLSITEDSPQHVGPLACITLQITKEL